MHCPCFRIFQAARSGLVHFHQEKVHEIALRQFPPEGLVPSEWTQNTKESKALTQAMWKLAAKKQIVANYTKKNLHSFLVVDDV